MANVLTMTSSILNDLETGFTISKLKNLPMILMTKKLLLKVINLNQYQKKIYQKYNEENPGEETPYEETPNDTLPSYRDTRTFFPTPPILVLVLHMKKHL